jgi:predicted TIM-barrel fold metal-dependent hydrolase
MMVIVDTWAQHPTLRFLSSDMFASVLRWTGALDFPELTIVCGHIGYPWTEEMIAVARKHERVFIDTSAYTAKRYPPELIAYMRTRDGSRKVLFGSNFPMIAPADALRDLDSLDLDDETRDAFLAGNARGVFALP